MHAIRVTQWFTAAHPPFVTDLSYPPDVGAYSRAPQEAATYHITNSPRPYTFRAVSWYTCFWEISWEGDGVLEYLAFWSPLGAPREAQQYAAVLHGLFEVLATVP